VEVIERMREFDFGGTNKNVGSWDVYARNVEIATSKQGFVGKAQKLSNGRWIGYGADTEVGPFKTRLEVAKALLALRS
jgi:hypothetical protein